MNYLGGDMPTFTLNFSRPGNQIVGQYYNFLRLGEAGYARIDGDAPRHRRAHLVARIAEMGPFEMISDGTAIPVFAFGLKDGAPFTVFHVSDQLRTAAGRCRRTRCRTTRPTWPCCASSCARASASTWPTISWMR